MNTDQAITRSEQTGTEGLNESLSELAVIYTEALKESLGESLVAVVLFGSVARREATAVSDIDLLLIASDLPDGRLARQQRLEAVDERLEPRLQRLRQQGILTDFCPILKTPAEARRMTPLYLDFVEDAVILYERGTFFSTILATLRRSLERLGARRLKRGQIRYWDLKPDYRPGEVFEL